LSRFELTSIQNALVVFAKEFFLAWLTVPAGFAFGLVATPVAAAIILVAIFALWAAICTAITAAITTVSAAAAASATVSTAITTTVAATGTTTITVATIATATASIFANFPLFHELRVEIIAANLALVAPDTSDVVAVDGFNSHAHRARGEDYDVP
jgi:hypothetical protein